MALDTSIEIDDLVGLTDAEIASMSDEVEETEETNDEADDNEASLDTDTDTDTDTDDQDQEDEQESVKDNISEQDIFVPKYESQLADNLGAQYQALENDYAKLSDELADKYETSELSFSEFQKETRDLNSRYYAEKSRLDKAILKNEIAVEQTKQNTEAKWQWEQDAFFKDNKDFKTDPVLFGALKATLDVMYQDQSNNGKTGLQFLREAAAKVNARIGNTNTNTVANNEITKPPKPKPGLKPALPQTLANIPAAETNDTGNGEFDYIDKLSGMQYEAAIARLSEEQKSRFFV